MSTEETRVSGLYFTVIDGTFRTRVEKDHPQAVMREYETKDGAKATKYERIVTSLAGYIEDIGIHESDYGKVIQIKLDPNSEGRNPIVQLSTETTYGEDFLKRLPGIDLSREVRLAPYAFTDDNGREQRGISVTQGEDKIKNFFYDGEKATNGFPEPEGDTENYTKEDWKIHFLRVRKFLINYATEHIIPELALRPKFVGTTQRNEEDIDPDSIPF
jgi:hypothetical protein